MQRLRYNFIALVGKSPVFTPIYKTLQKEFPEKILFSEGNKFINYDVPIFLDVPILLNHRILANVLFVVNHDITVAPYKNNWLDYISGLNSLSNQAIGIISYPENVKLTEYQEGLFQTFMHNERQSLIRGYYPVRYDASIVRQKDIANVVSAIRSALLE